MRRILTVLAAVALLAGCGSDTTPELLPPPAAPSTPPSAAPSTPETQPTSPSKKPVSKKPTTKPPTKRPPVIPDDLVGAWETVTERGNAFSYELYADGKYIYNGIMEVDGLRYELSEGGRASISGSQITFKPQIVEMVRKENGSETTTRPQRDARRMTFRLSGNRLTFTEADGAGSVYQRA
jgi:hypothetical protein